MHIEEFHPPHLGTYTPRKYRGKETRVLVLAMKRSYGKTSYLCQALDSALPAVWRRSGVSLDAKGGQP